MGDEIRDKLISKIKEQGDLVRNMKSAKAEKAKVICLFTLKIFLFTG